MDTIHLNMNNMKKYVINLKRRPDRLEYFKQVCPIEMLDKLDQPITHKNIVKKVS